MTETAAEGSAPVESSAPAVEAAEAPQAEPSVFDGLDEGSPADATVQAETAEAIIEALTPEEQSQLEGLLSRHQIGLKLDGEEKSFSFDDLQKLAQKGYGADSRFEEAAAMRKEAQSQQQVFEDFLTALRENPSAVLSREDMMGQKYRSHIEEELTRQLQEEMLSPEDREKNTKLREYEEMKQREQQRIREDEANQAKALQDKYAEDYDKQFSDALEGGGLPRTPQTVMRMAQLTQAALQKGVDASPSELVDIIRDEYRNDIKTMLGGAKDDSLLDFLGDDVATKLRKQDLSRIKTPTHRQSATASAPKSGLGRKEGMSMADFEARNAKIMEGLG